MTLEKALWIIWLCCIPLSTAAQKSDDITGIWLRDDKKNYKVKIYPCGKSFCGSIVWLAEPNDQYGKPRLDVNNPDPTKRNQPLQGMTILRDFKFNGSTWTGGKVYSFNRGKEYKAQIKMKDEELYLTITVLFITRTYRWIKSE